MGEGIQKFQKRGRVTIMGKVYYLKGYIRYKTITSQNVSFEAQIKNFLFRSKIMFHSQDIQVFLFFTIL